MSKDNGKLYRSLFEFRQSGDYDDLKTIDKEDVTVRFEPAKQFIATIEKLIFTSRVLTKK
ncbi:MAG: HEPN domain-containing protein [Bacteroidales bacterium]|nr:HEPN domain-containing protein [Bacteroidales bacterium]